MVGLLCSMRLYSYVYTCNVNAAGTTQGNNIKKKNKTRNHE